MKTLITIAAAALTVYGLGLGRAAAEHPGGYVCTPCGPVGQYNAFSPVYKDACCPRCGHPLHDKHCHLTQFNAFSPQVEDCSKKGWFRWLHHGGNAKPAGDCAPTGCDWGYQGDLPDCGTASADSGPNVFPQGVSQGQPVGPQFRPMPEPPPATGRGPANAEPIGTPTQK